MSAENQDNENRKEINLSQYTNETNVSNNKNNPHNETDSSDTKTSEQIETGAQTDKLSTETDTKNIITTDGDNKQYNCIVQTEASENTPLLYEHDYKNNAKVREMFVGYTFDNEYKEIMQKNDDIIIQTKTEEHQLTRIGNRLYCQRCNKHISISVKNINEHVTEELHKSNSQLSGGHLKENNENKEVESEDSNFQKEPTFQFVKLLATADYEHAVDVIINKKYCINQFAFSFLTEATPKQLWCYVCEEYLPSKNLKGHLRLIRHDIAVKVVPFLIRADSEFLREIGPGKYHCGYCNILEPWEAMEKHFESAEHKENKDLANCRLLQNLRDFKKQNKKHKRVRHGEFGVINFFK